MGAITDLLESLSVTPLHQEQKQCNRLQAAPPGAVTRVTPVTPQNSKYKSHSPKRPVLAFTINDSPKRITAIDTQASTLDEALARLQYSWGQHLARVWSADGHLIWERNQYTTPEQST